MDDAVDGRPLRGQMMGLWDSLSPTMDESPPDILILDQKIDDPANLAHLAAAFMDPAIRERVRELTFALIGEGGQSG